MNKTCSNCGETKDAEKFFFKDGHKPQGYRCTCKSCDNEYRKGRQTKEFATLLKNWRPI